MLINDILGYSDDNLIIQYLMDTKKAFGRSVVNLKRFYLDIQGGTFKIEGQCLISQLMLSLQVRVTTGYRRGIKLFRIPYSVKKIEIIA